MQVSQAVRSAFSSHDFQICSKLLWITTNPLGAIVCWFCKVSCITTRLHSYHTEIEFTAGGSALVFRFAFTLMIGPANVHHMYPWQSYILCVHILDPGLATIFSNHKMWSSQQAIFPLLDLIPEPLQIGPTLRLGERRHRRRSINSSVALRYQNKVEQGPINITNQKLLALSSTTCT
jgi:hypothetical protein